MTAKTQTESTDRPHAEMRRDVHSKIRSITPVPNGQGMFLLFLNIGTWIISAAVAIYSLLLFRNDLRGTEWLGSPLFGLPLLVALVTAYYFFARNKSVEPAAHAVVCLFILLLITIANMWTLARFVFGGWKSFQYMPVMGAFELVLMASGIHISWKEKSRGALFQFLVWTMMLFLLAAVTLVFLNIAFHSSVWRIGTVAGSGAVVWIGLLLIAYFGFRSRFGSLPDALICWAWCMVAGAVASMLPGYFYLNQKQLIPFFIFAGTSCFAILATALTMFSRRLLIREKA